MIGALYEFFLDTKKQPDGTTDLPVQPSVRVRAMWIIAFACVVGLGPSDRNLLSHRSSQCATQSSGRWYRASHTGTASSGPRWRMQSGGKMSSSQVKCLLLLFFSCGDVTKLFWDWQRQKGTPAGPKKVEGLKGVGRWWGGRTGSTYGQVA